MKTCILLLACLAFLSFSQNDNCHLPLEVPNGDIRMPSDTATLQNESKVTAAMMFADSIFVSDGDITGMGNSHGEHDEMTLEEIASKAGKASLFFVDNQKQPSDFDILSLNPQIVEQVLIAYATDVAYMDGKKLKDKTLVMIKTKR